MLLGSPPDMVHGAPSHRTRLPVCPKGYGFKCLLLLYYKDKNKSTAFLRKQRLLDRDFFAILFLVMLMEQPTRKEHHLYNYDYSHAGAYFVTICTKDRLRVLSEIHTVGAGVLDRPRVALLPYGVIADRYIRQLHEHYDHLSVDTYVIMPDHIHLLIRLYDNGRSGTPAPTNANSAIAQFVSTFKRFCNKEYGKNIWQRSYYDHIIRNDHDYREVWQYIQQNPDRANEQH